MTVMELMGFVVGIALGAFLFYAMLFPERL